MKLLVSPINVEEAKTCKSGGADIIDVKNPKEGTWRKFPVDDKRCEKRGRCSTFERNDR